MVSPVRTSAIFLPSVELAFFAASVEEHHRGRVLPRPVGRIFVVLRLVGIAPGGILRRRREGLDVAVAGMDALRQVLHHRERGVVGHVDREHLHLAEHRVDVGLVDVGGEIAAPQARIQRLRLGLQDLGHHFGVVGLEQLWPGLADDLDVGREALQVQRELAGGVAAIGIVRRAGRPLLQALGLRRCRPRSCRRRWSRECPAARSGRHSECAAWDRPSATTLPSRCGCRARRDRARPRAPRTIRTTPRRRSAISQPSVLTSSRATRAASCGWPLESRITISIWRPARPPAALTFSTSSITALREDVPSCATRPDRDRRHADLDGLGLRARHPGRGNTHRTGAHQRQCRTAADARLAGSRHFPSLCRVGVSRSLSEIVSSPCSQRFQRQGVTSSQR